MGLSGLPDPESSVFGGEVEILTLIKCASDLGKAFPNFTLEKGISRIFGDCPIKA